MAAALHKPRAYGACSLNGACSTCRARPKTGRARRLSYVPPIPSTGDGRQTGCRPAPRACTLLHASERRPAEAQPESEDRSFCSKTMMRRMWVRGRRRDETRSSATGTSIHAHERLSEAGQTKGNCEEEQVAALFA